MVIFNRIKDRLADEIDVDEQFILEAATTITDRLNLRLGTSELPEQFNSIVVDAAVKMFRRKYHEGIENERIDMINTTFVNNVLEEYELEIQAYISSSNQEEESAVKKVVRFI